MLKKYTLITLSALALAASNTYTSEVSIKEACGGRWYRIMVNPESTTNAEFADLIAQAQKTPEGGVIVIWEGKVIPRNQEIMNYAAMIRCNLLFINRFNRVSKIRLAWLDVTTRHNRDAHITTAGAYVPQSTIAPDIFKTTASTASAKTSCSDDLD